MSQIPEGATHRSQGHYYKKEGPSWMLYGSASQWIETACLWEWLDENAEPLTPAWTGEGLPPAGTACEWKEKTGFSWVKATVLFITESSVVMQREDGFEWQMMTARAVFRPFRTPEQIAAEVRENNCEAMLEIIKASPWGMTAGPQEVIALLYDAGYRKFEITEE